MHTQEDPLPKKYDFIFFLLTILLVIDLHRHCRVPMLVVKIQWLDQYLYLYQYQIKTSHQLLLQLKNCRFLLLRDIKSNQFYYQDFQVIQILLLDYANIMLYSYYRIVNFFANKKMPELFGLLQLIHVYHL